MDLSHCMESPASDECRCSEIKTLERRRNRDQQRCLAHSLVGTPNYIAPEVLLGQGITFVKKMRYRGSYMSAHVLLNFIK